MFSVRNGLIEEASYSGIILPSADWHTLNHHGTTARITYRVRVQCDLNYYNSTCTKFCRPRNDKFGHYNCDSNGDKECIDGWKGANCEIGEHIVCLLLSCQFDIYYTAILYKTSDLIAKSLTLFSC